MEEKRLAGYKAAEYIQDGMILGLGTGSTAYYLIERVGQMVRDGLRMQAVATSQSTEKLAGEMDIPLLSIDEADRIDLAIDGVDEIDGDFNAIKGGGGALLREKIVAAMADRVIWIMDSSKRVDAIGGFPLPVEVLPYGYSHVIRKMDAFSYHPVLRMKDGVPFVTDNHNYIVDLHLGKGFVVDAVSKQLKSMPGVLETGLFLNMCDQIIVGAEGTALAIDNKRKSR